MEKKARELVYLDTERYMSLDNLRVFYWGIIIIPVIMLVMGIVGKIIFPVVSILLWSLLYWIFVVLIQSKYIKKTFELRFFVNGICGLFLSSLFLILFLSFDLVADADKQFLGFNFYLWILVFYLSFSLIYVLAIIIGVHKGIFARIKQMSKSKTILVISAFFGTLIPCSGILGIYVSRMMRSHARLSIQYAVITVFMVLLIFIPALAHINFVQYFYCKKYGIVCDENGDTTSPMLERQNRKKTSTRKEQKNQHKKKTPLISKILITIVSVPIIFFLAVFLIAFIKTIIENI